MSQVRKAPTTLPKSKLLPQKQPTAAANSPPDLTEEMRKYLVHRAVRGSTVQGMKAIRRYVRDFVDWCQDRQILRISQITPDVLESYLHFLHAYRKKDGEPLLVNSRLAKLVPVRGWCAWLVRQGKLPANPAQAMDLPRADCMLPRVLLSLQDVEQVLAVPDVTTAVGLRDRAMMEVLFSTGIRRMELAGLTLVDLDLPRRLLLVRRGKGRKDRMLPLGERAGRWVQRYLASARPLLLRGADDGWLFPGHGGRALSLQWLSQIVALHVRAAQIGKRGSCHLMRHAMATLMLEGGADIRYIQTMLGHAQLVSTQIYTHVAIGRLQVVHAATHPTARQVDDELSPG